MHVLSREPTTGPLGSQRQNDGEGLYSSGGASSTPQPPSPTLRLRKSSKTDPLWYWSKRKRIVWVLGTVEMRAKANQPGKQEWTLGIKPCLLAVPGTEREMGDKTGGRREHSQMPARTFSSCLSFVFLNLNVTSSEMPSQICYPHLSFTGLCITGH